MAKKWYPVIDYMTCTECGLCVENCPHDVYNKAKAPTPVVTNPTACVDHCRFCANNCPANAISYVGDNGDAKAADSCCGGGCCEDTKEAADSCCGGGCCGDDDESCCNGDTKEASCCGGDTKEASCCGGGCCGDDESADCGCGDEDCGCGDEDCGCGCGCGCDDAHVEKKALIEYLYLDLHTCDRCVGTDKVLAEVVQTLTPALQLAGYTVALRKTEMVTEEIAQYHEFLSSPTIRVNGRDICQSVTESKCGCCGEISGTDVDCRVFEFGGKRYEVPPKEMLAMDILKTLFAEGEDCDCGEGCDCGKAYEMPDNLKEFFKGKSKKATGWCKESCC